MGSDAESGAAAEADFAFDGFGAFVASAWHVTGCWKTLFQRSLQSLENIFSRVLRQCASEAAATAAAAEGEELAPFSPHALRWREIAASSPSVRRSAVSSISHSESRAHDSARGAPPGGGGGGAESRDEGAEAVYALARALPCSVCCSWRDGDAPRCSCCCCCCGGGGGAALQLSRSPTSTLDPKSSVRHSGATSLGVAPDALVTNSWMRCASRSSSDRRNPEEMSSPFVFHSPPLALASAAAASFSKRAARLSARRHGLIRPSIAAACAVCTSCARSASRRSASTLHASRCGTARSW
eukprot:6186376-Pleurochrysis_carterae.AAC.6